MKEIQVTQLEIGNLIKSEDGLFYVMLSKKGECKVYPFNVTSTSMRKLKYIENTSRYPFVAGYDLSRDGNRFFKITRLATEKEYNDAKDKQYESLYTISC